MTNIPRYTVTISEGKWGRPKFSMEPLPNDAIDLENDSYVDQMAWVIWHFLKDLEPSL